MRRAAIHDPIRGGTVQYPIPWYAEVKAEAWGARNMFAMLSPSTTEAVALGSSHQALVHRVPAAEQGVRQRGVLAAGVR